MISEKTIPEIFYQPEAIGDDMPLDKDRKEHSDYEVWENREQCQALFPESIIQEYKVDDIGGPYVFFENGEEKYFEE